MKTITAGLILLVLTCQAGAQWQYTKKDAYIAGSICVVTIAVLANQGDNMTEGQRAAVAFTGIATATIYSVYKTTDLHKKVQRKLHRRCRSKRCQR